MSAQAGIWNFDEKPFDPRLCVELSELLKQQGPDGEFCYTEESVALIYRPFHTTTESRIEKQPHRSARGFLFTWDGRLDNRDELMAQLHGDLTFDHTDITIVAAAFERWGLGSFRKLIGDWSVSIWKPIERELIFASDYMSIRHIFYHLGKDRILWSTDLAPLVLLSGGGLHIDDDYISGYFAHDPDADRTPYCEIRQVPPGKFVRVRNGVAQIERFWWVSSKSRIRYKTDSEYEEHFRHLFRQSVRRRLRSDSPILAELSGGLDSSSIVCIADDIIAKKEVQSLQLGTVSYHNKSEPHGDDWFYFPKVEQKRGRVGHHIDASKFGTSCASFECADFNALPGFLASGRQLEDDRATVVRSGGYRAVLSGLGGDEFMGGIPNPSALLADLVVQLKVLKLAQQLTAWSLVKRRPWIRLLWEASLELLPYWLGKHLVKQARVEPWIERRFAKRTGIVRRLLDVEEKFGFWLPTRRSYISGLLLMANKMAKCKPPSIALEEPRYPYLDQDLLEFILAIPADQILRPGERRSLMRRSLVGLVPDEILTRKTKQLGARTPILAMETNLKEVQLAFDSPLSTSLGYVNQHRFLTELRAAMNGKGIHIARMMKTISLEFWLRDLVSRRLIDSVTPAHASVTSASQEARV